MQIDLLGTSFTIQTDEDPQYVQDLVDYFRTKVQEVQKRISSRDPLKTAIVAGVLTTDELFRLRADQRPGSDREDTSPGVHPADASPGEAEKMAEITQQLIEALDRSLSDGGS